MFGRNVVPSSSGMKILFFCDITLPHWAVCSLFFKGAWCLTLQGLDCCDGLLLMAVSLLVPAEMPLCSCYHWPTYCAWGYCWNWSEMEGVIVSVVSTCRILIAAQSGGFALLVWWSVGSFFPVQ